MHGSNFRYFLCIALYLSLSSYGPTNALDSSASKQVWVNVFIHGIISIKPLVTLSNFMRFLTDNVYDSPYAQTIELMRQDPFFYQNQPVQQNGLIPVDMHNHKPGAAASCMANIFAHVNALNEVEPTTQLFYTFGWSGLLSRAARYCDAKILFQELEKLVPQLQSQGINPKIRIVGYSHGGTLGIKLAMVKRIEHIMPNFQVDELIILGTPIQYDTDYLIADPLFKKVYNVFSRGDRFQKLDFFSCGEFFSEQIFTPHCGFEKLPDKLVQVEIRLIRKKGEQCKPLCPTDEHQPLLYDGKRCTRAIRNVSPGHTEMWFWGWTPLHYRKTLPLYPLPVAAILPYVLNALKPFESHFKPERAVAVTIDIRRNSIVINNNLLCPHIYKLTFMGIDNFLALKEEALSYKPDPALFNQKTYDEHIDIAFEEAMRILKAKRCNRPY